MDYWISNKDVAAQLGITTNTLFRWVKDQKIGFPPPIKIGGTRYFSEDQFTEWRAARLAGDASLKTWEPLDKHVAILPKLPKRHKCLRVDKAPFV